MIATRTLKRIEAKKLGIRNLCKGISMLDSALITTKENPKTTFVVYDRSIHKTKSPLKEKGSKKIERKEHQLLDVT